MNKIAPRPIHITKISRISIEVEHELAQLLDRYIQFYKDRYGATVSRPELVAQMARQFMAADRSFQTYCRKPRRNTNRKPKVESSNANAPTQLRPPSEAQL